MNSRIDGVPNVASRLIDTLIAGNRGDQQAFSYNGKRYSYQDVAALMNRAGNLALNLGVRPGERVLLLLPASPAFVASVLGVMKAGAVPVIDVPRDPAEIERCIAAAKPAADSKDKDNKDAKQPVAAEAVPATPESVPTEEVLTETWSYQLPADE